MISNCRSPLVRYGAAVFAAGVALLLGLAGCYETTLHLGKAEDAKVDTKLVGDWKFILKEDSGKEVPTKLIVRNFDGKQYYAEWTEGEGKPKRMRGQGFTFGSAMFVELTDLTDDGSLADKHLILRIEQKDDSLTLRQLSEKFFEGVTTDAALQEKIKSNLDNAEMYAEKTTGTRTGP